MKPDPDKDSLWCKCGWSMPIRGDQFRITLQEDLPRCPKQRWWNWPLHRTMVHYKPWTPDAPHATAQVGNEEGPRTVDFSVYPPRVVDNPDLRSKRAMKELDDCIPATSPLRPAINELVRQQYLKDLRPAPDLPSEEELKKWAELDAETERQMRQAHLQPDDGGDK